MRVYVDAFRMGFAQQKMTFSFSYIGNVEQKDVIHILVMALSVRKPLYTTYRMLSK